jgi:hypothetical protein
LKPKELNLILVTTEEIILQPMVEATVVIVIMTLIQYLLSKT